MASLARFITGSLVSALALVGCGHHGGGGGGGGGGGPDSSTNGTPAFEIRSPDITLNPGQEITDCYYFHTSNTATVAVNKWVSDLTPGSHHMIMFLNPNGTQPADGTVDQNCGLGGGGMGTNIPVWTYSTQMPHQEADLPPDDGTGKPLAQKIAANSAGYLQMHYLNTTDTALTVHVDLQAFALAANATFTQTDAYVTYNYDLSIPPHASALNTPPDQGSIWTASCPTPPGVKFWSLSTHSHKQSVETEVLDGSSMLVQSMDWQHPAIQLWPATPFYAFTSNTLTWTCKYANTGSNAANTITSGQSAQTNEMCMAAGYFFPSTGPKFEVQYSGNCYAL